METVLLNQTGHFFVSDYDAQFGRDLLPQFDLNISIDGTPLHCKKRCDDVADCACFSIDVEDADCHFYSQCSTSFNQYRNTFLKNHYMIDDFSNTSAKSFALRVSELGEVMIEDGTGNVLKTYPGPPPISPVTCSCLGADDWTTMARGIANMTASKCARICQSDSKYAFASPRTDGECWCGTMLPDAPANCTPTCALCVGSPVEVCGFDKSVSIYTWNSSSSDGHHKKMPFPIVI